MADEGAALALTLPNWLSVETLLDPDDTRALYPYPLLDNILAPEDSRAAVLNETGVLEAEFGADLLLPLYQLLWRLNTIDDIFTSHLTVSHPDHPSPFEWAKCFIGAAIVILPRKQELRHDERAAEGMAHALARLLAESSVVPSNTAGWQLRLFPTVVTCAYSDAFVDGEGKVFSTGTTQRVGYAHELVISGSAGTRRRAAERMIRATSFVLETLNPLAQRAPYQHYVLVNGVRTVPGVSELDAGRGDTPLGEP
jgi:hypothetical protein